MSVKKIKVSKGIDGKFDEDVIEDVIASVQESGKTKHLANKNTGAMREKMDSLRYDYMPQRITNEAYARVAAFGHKKYDIDNWAKGLPVSQIASSLQRHLWDFMEGNDRDNGEGGSGELHTDHILWNAIALCYAMHHNLEDDRFQERIIKY